ncbi:MAG: tetratricopeptide repeat protein [Deltaproteobacteria bacterium]|nr:tetratricopeptide repeat protein [Deltaproteobacteria bacterium]
MTEHSGESMFRRAAAGLGVLAFLSGAAGLAYEVIWTRLMELVFGYTQAAVSASVASYMAGLALGAFLAGRRVDRIRNPIFVYGFLELIVGFYSLGVPSLLNGATGIYSILGVSPSSLSLTLWRMVACFVILAPATMAMGATLPLLVRALDSASASEKTGRTAAFVYGINTAGAVIGALLTGLVLFPVAGLRIPIWLAAGTSISVGFGAMLLGRRGFLVRSIADGHEPPRARSDEADDQGSGILSSDEEDDLSALSWSPARWTPATWTHVAAVSAAFFGGVASLGNEVLWSRVFGLLLDGTVYGFSVLLGGFLLGLALGSLAISPLLDRRRLDLWDLLVGLHLMAGLSAFVLMALVSVMPEMAAKIIGSGLSVRKGFYLKSMLAMAVLLLPTVFYGAALPTAIRLAASVQDVAKATGRLSAASTLGGIVGAVFVGLVLMSLGLRLSQAGIIATGMSFLAAVIVAWIGIGVRAWSIRPDRRFWFRTAAPRIGLPIIVFFGIAALHPDFKPVHLVQARYAIEDYGKELDYRIQGMGRANLAFEAEGKQTIVTVRRSKDGGFRLRNNGLNEAYHSLTAPHFSDVIFYLGVLGYIVQPQAGTALLVGLGSGGTAESLLQTNLRRLMVVELEPKVVEASRFIYARIGDKNSPHPLNDPRATLVVDDARNYLLRRAHTGRPGFDLVVSQPSHPWLAGMSALYTVQFFRLVRRNLSPHGIYCQWVNLFRMDEPSLRSILAAATRVFQSVHAFRPDSNSLLLVCSKAQRPINLRVMKQHLDEPHLAAAFRQRSLSLLDILLMYAFGPSRARRLAAGARPNEDLEPVVEMRLPWQSHNEKFDVRRFVTRNHLPFGLESADLDPLFDRTDFWMRLATAAVQAVEAGKLSFRRGRAMLARIAKEHGLGDDGLRLEARLRLRRGDEDGALSLYHRAAAKGDFLSAYQEAKLRLERGETDQAVRLFGSLVDGPFDFRARVGLAEALADRASLRARALLEFVLDAPAMDVPEEAWNRALLLLARMERSEGNLGRAEQLVRRHLQWQPDSADGRFLLGSIQDMEGLFDEAKDQYSIAVRRRWVLAEAYSNTGKIAADHGHLDRAWRYYEKATDADPGYAPPYKWMARAMRRAGGYRKMLDVIDRLKLRSREDVRSWVEQFHRQDTVAQRLGRVLAEIDREQGTDSAKRSGTIGG